MGGIFVDEVPAMPEIETGTVSGDCDLVSTNPWQTSGELKYTVPGEAKEITSAKVIVNIYSGSGAPTYALYSNTTLQTKNGQVELGYEDLQYPDNLAGDECVYSINDHTTKQYSDYQMIYDITNNVKFIKWRYNYY